MSSPIILLEHPPRIPFLAELRRVRWPSLHTCWRCCGRRTACSCAGASANGRSSGICRSVQSDEVVWLTIALAHIHGR